MTLCDTVKSNQMILDTLLKNMPTEDSVADYIKIGRKSAALHIYLRNSRTLFDYREKALADINQLMQSSDENTFSVNRYLRFMAYQMTSWAIYDNIFNVVGRIISLPEISEDNSQNPKLPALYQKEKAGKICTFFVHKYTKSCFAWPCAFSYEIRNWLAHEGDSRGSTPLFCGNNKDDGFILSDIMKKHINDTIYKDYQNSHRDKGRFDILWNEGDLLKLLEYANGEIDALYEILLPWAVETLKKQVEIFK